MTPWNVARMIMAKASEAASNGKLKIIITLTATLGVLVGVSATSILALVPIYNRLATVETSQGFILKEIAEVKDELKDLRRDKEGVN